MNLFNWKFLGSQPYIGLAFIKQWNDHQVRKWAGSRENNEARITPSWTVSEEKWISFLHFPYLNSSTPVLWGLAWHTHLQGSNIPGEVGFPTPRVLGPPGGRKSAPSILGAYKNLSSEGCLQRKDWRGKWLLQGLLWSLPNNGAKAKRWIKK